MKTTRYYGLIDYSVKPLVFRVHCIVPPDAPLSAHVGKPCKLTDKLCLDDFCLSSIPNLEVDFSLVRS